MKKTIIALAVMAAAGAHAAPVVVVPARPVIIVPPRPAPAPVRVAPAPAKPATHAPKAAEHVRSTPAPLVVPPVITQSCTDERRKRKEC